MWLPSGGSLIIEHTEALTVIDVNTGKNVGTSNLEETVFHNNLEAADEIAKQLRLRDIGGIIVIDFIDMEIQDNRRKVVDAFRDALARDKTRTQVFDISELGLVEMTRKRIGEGLLTNFADQCPNCEGRGVRHRPRPAGLSRRPSWPVVVGGSPDRSHGYVRSDRIRWQAGPSRRRPAGPRRAARRRRGQRGLAAPRARSSTATPCSPPPTSSKGASVTGTVVGTAKGPKIDGFTYKRRTNQRRRYGHRQKYSRRRDHLHHEGLNRHVEDQRWRLHPQRPRLQRTAPRRQGVRRHASHTPARSSSASAAPSSTRASNVGIGGDDTLFALTDGAVKFGQRGGRKVVDVEPLEAS